MHSDELHFTVPSISHANSYQEQYWTELSTFFEEFYGPILTFTPAAYDTIRAHLADTGRSSSFYDLIVTGDLGKLGKALVEELFRRDGVELGNYDDCGLMLYRLEQQDVHCGGSGCGCSAAVLTGLLLPGLKEGRWHNILFCGTGALHSPTALGQGESVPGICHAVALSDHR